MPKLKKYGRPRTLSAVILQILRHPTHETDYTVSEYLIEIAAFLPLLSVGDEENGPMSFTLGAPWNIQTSVRQSFRSSILTVLAFLGVFSFLPVVLAQGAKPAISSQSRSAVPAKAVERTIPALLISDIHFDPFHDPAKVHELAASPVSKWRSILSAPPSSDQKQAFAALQQSCHARGVETTFALLDSSLRAMRSRQSDAKFMTVSGDLIAHAFSCRYATSFPNAVPGDYQAFVLKTMSFVIEELRAPFPNMPVYVALGNNDTECGDYQLDPSSEFLAQAGRIVAEGLPLSQRQQALHDFAQGGYYSVTMAEPMRDTRLIVVNDLFLSSKYSTCSGKPDSAAATAEMTWLDLQLAQARQAGQKVWVMGHIPPGIDSYSTVAKFRNVCGGQAPVLFLSSQKMADLLIEYADVVRLGIFGHTHMDEMRILEPEGNQLPAKDSGRVAVKLVSSISPGTGNNPSFTIARINPTSAALKNFDVVAASNQTGIATTWATEYDFAQTYHETQYTPATVKGLIEVFKADHEAKASTSKAYIHNYFVGDRSLELSPFWSQYVCSLDSYTAKTFATCYCAGVKE